MLRRWTCTLVLAVLGSVLWAAASPAADLRTVKLKATLDWELIGSFRTEQDKGRCVAVVFVRWPEVPGATRYRVVVVEPGMDYTVDGAPPFSGDKVSLAAGAKVVDLPEPYRAHRLKLNTYSSGDGCDHARGEALKRAKSFKIVSATAWVDPAQAKKPKPVLQCVKPVPPVDNFWDDSPPGAIGRVAEIDGGTAWLLRKNSTRFIPLLQGTWISPGDIVATGPTVTAAVEYVNGGRVGLNRGVGARFLLGKVEGVPEFTSPDQYRNVKAKRIWKKMSTPKEPLEIETAGGVLGGPDRTSPWCR